MEFLPPMEWDTHPLLEESSPSYSFATVRRAFIVWLRCGRRNEFRDVCNYYHRLEAMEDQLPADTRASSRHLEHYLYMNPPPTSAYLQEMFPNMYTPLYIDYSLQYARITQNYQMATTSVQIEEVKEIHTQNEERKSAQMTSTDIFEASQVFKTPTTPVKRKTTKLEVSEFLKQSAEAIKKEETKKMNELNNACMVKPYNVDDKLKGTSKQDIVETSQMIKNYCKDQHVPLRNFLENFKEYATRCELANTVNNVGFYIKRKMVHAELTLAVVVHRTKHNNVIRTMPKTPKASESIEIDVNETMIDQTKTKPIVKIPPMDLKNNGENIWNRNFENGTENFANEDVITFDDNTPPPDQSENILRLLRREDELKTTAGFSNLHNIALKLETLKCRKI